MRPLYIGIGTAILVVMIAILAVLIFGLEGTPTGTTRASLTPDKVCKGMTGDALRQCLEGSRDPAGGAADARETESSSNTGRSARGSGIEGVTSGGTTVDPPGR